MLLGRYLLYVEKFPQIRCVAFESIPKLNILIGVLIMIRRSDSNSYYSALVQSYLLPYCLNEKEISRNLRLFIFLVIFTRNKYCVTLSQHSHLSF